MQPGCVGGRERDAGRYTGWPAPRQIPAMTDTLESARPWVGRWLRGTGLVNLALAVVAYRDRLGGLLAAGAWNAVAALPSGALAVWCVASGALLVLLGELAAAHEERGLPLPAGVGWGLLVLGAAGGVLVPASTFWLLLPPGLAIVRAAGGRVGGR